MRKIIQLTFSILENVLNNYILSRFDKGIIHNDLGASFTNIQRKKKTIIKRAQKEGEEKLIDEINWYLKWQNTPLRYWLPKVVDYSLTRGNIFYEMKYYHYPNLRKIIMYRGNANFVVKTRWKTIFKILLKNFYLTKKSIISPDDFVKKSHLDKLQKRIALIKKKAPFFQEILKQPFLTINQKKYLNYEIIIKAITKKPKIIKNLTPPRLYISHGDLHTNNILCGINPQKIILLDARGKSPTGSDYFDPAYDLAKIYHDLRSYYSLIEKNLYSLFYQKNTKGEIFLEYSFTDQGFLEEFQKNCHWVNELVDKSLKEFPRIKYRADFTEAMLFLTMIPMHLKTKAEAIMCWIMGVKRLNEWVRNYHPALLKDLEKKVFKK